MGEKKINKKIGLIAAIVLLIFWAGYIIIPAIEYNQPKEIVQEWYGHGLGDIYSCPSCGHTIPDIYYYNIIKQNGEGRCYDCGQLIVAK